MSQLKIEVLGAVLAKSEPAALAAAIDKAMSYVGNAMDDFVVTIHPSMRRQHTDFLEWGLDVYKNGDRLIYLGMIQRHATAPFEFHS